MLIHEIKINIAIPDQALAPLDADTREGGVDLISKMLNHVLSGKAVHEWITAQLSQHPFVGGLAVSVIVNDRDTP